MMKGELSFIEYVASMVIFISFVAYIFFLLLRYYPLYVQEMESERKRLEAYQISELLINDFGEPANWGNLKLNELDSVKRVGLSDDLKNKTNFLNMTKINLLKNLCDQDYYKVKEKIGSEFDFSLILVDLSNNQVLISCFPPRIVITPTNISVRRIAAFSSGGYGELTVQVW